MGHGESNGMVLDVVACAGLLIRNATFTIDKIAWKYRKTANIIEKNC